MTENKPKSLAELCKKIQEFPTTAPYKVDKLEFAQSYIEEIKKWHRGLLEDLKKLQEQIAKLDFHLCILCCQVGCESCVLKELEEVLGAEKGVVKQ